MIKVDILSISFCKKEIIFLYLQHRQGAQRKFLVGKF